MSDAQQPAFEGGGASRPPSVPRMNIAAEPKTSDSQETTVKIPSAWVKWIKGNFAILLVGGYIGGDRLLAGYVSAPQDIAELRRDVKDLKNDVSVILQQ